LVSALNKSFDRLRTNGKLLILFAITCIATPLHAQPWTPTRNIEITVSSGPGGAADREARELQKHMQRLPGMPPITVNNRPGGGGSIAWLSLNQHQGDAHWIATMNVALMANHILGASQLHHRDLTPLAMLMREYVVVWTHAASPIKSVKDLLARLKADPSSVSFGQSPALGSQNHIVLGMLAKAAGVDPRALKIVVYAGGGSGITAALGGHLDAWAGTVGGAIPLAHAGKINVMGISAEKRLSGKAVALPTFREQGIDAVYAAYRGSVGPGGLSAAQRAYWDATFAKIVNTPEWKATALEHAWEPEYKNSSDARAYLDAEYPKLRKTLVELGLAK
jgi:putative tricarboxylic transport membrane protein